MSVTMWFDTPFKLRAKSEQGAVLATFSPGPTACPQVGLDTPEPVYIEDEKLDYTPTAYHVCEIPTWVVALETLDGITIPGDAGYSSLEAVLNADSGSGTFLEVCMDGSNWIPVKKDGSPTKTKINERTVGVRVELALRGLVKTTSPYRTS